MYGYRLGYNLVQLGALLNLLNDVIHFDYNGAETMMALDYEGEETLISFDYEG